MQVHSCTCMCTKSKAYTFSYILSFLFYILQNTLSYTFLFVNGVSFCNDISSPYMPASQFRHILFMWYAGGLRLAHHHPHRCTQLCSTIVFILFHYRYCFNVSLLFCVRRGTSVCIWPILGKIIFVLLSVILFQNFFHTISLLCFASSLSLSICTIPIVLVGENVSHIIDNCL